MSDIFQYANTWAVALFIVLFLAVSAAGGTPTSRWGLFFLFMGYVPAWILGSMLVDRVRYGGEVSNSWWLNSAPPGNLDWQDNALCREVSADLFFPGMGESPNPAKQVCFSCRVRNDCLSYALSMPGINGVFGGTTEKERRRLRAARFAAQKAGSPRENPNSPSEGINRPSS